MEKCIKVKDSQSKELIINRCKVTINFAPESDERTIKMVKNILLSTYYQDISTESEGNLAG